MESFFDIVLSFFRDMFSYTLIAVFLENTIFSRALGVSTSLYAVRKKLNVLLFGLIMTIIIVASSLLVYFIYPVFKGLSFYNLLIPVIYVAVIGIIYVLALLITNRFLKKYKQDILSIIHVSAFNCASLGALLLATGITDLSLGGFLGFGIGTGIGFTLATFLVKIAYRRLSSERIPVPFRGFPITLIYIGIVSLAIYGLIGHELPF